MTGFPPKDDGTGPRTARPIPAIAGIGLRTEHVKDFAPGADDPRPDCGWLEVHSENYLADGGPRLRVLDDLRRDYPLSCHGVALSLGSAEGLSKDMLARLARLFERYEPDLISEHVAWSVVDGVYLNDLLPIPYTEEALEVMCRNIDAAQDAFGRTILMENPSTYARFVESDIPEPEFLSEMVRRTGCGLLLDVNNIHVSAFNNGFDARTYLDGIPGDAVGEIHVAGHKRWTLAGADGRDQPVLIDTHNDYVADPVWELLDAALARFGPRPVLVEWDAQLPPLSDLIGERDKAQARIDAAAGRRSDAA